jgi:sugar lactone lactonase YvrE
MDNTATVRGRRAARLLVLLAALGLAAATLPSGTGAAAAGPALPGVPGASAAATITTVAGGLGDGPARSVSQSPTAVARSGDRLYVSDDVFHVIRVIDLRSGHESVVAGNGVRGFSGDGGPATAASLDHPGALAADAAGSVYVVDSYGTRVRKVARDGTISTVAGTGSLGFSGETGPAVLAQVYEPRSLVVDGEGNLLLADTYNFRVRKVATDGTISTVAGTGTRGFSGDGGPATAAQLASAEGITLDAAGALYIADTGNNRVRRVATDGTISTIAGTGLFDFSGDGGPAREAALHGPTRVAVDASGSVFVADANNHRLRRITPDGTIGTVAGNGEPGINGDGGPATSARLGAVYAMALAVSGELYMATGQRVRVVVPGGTIDTFAGTGLQSFSGDGGPATSAQLSAVVRPLVDARGDVLLADSHNRRVRRVGADGVISTVAGTDWDLDNRGFSGDGGPATSAAMDPSDLGIDVAGNLYIADLQNARVRRVAPDGVVTTVAGNGSEEYSGDGGPATAAGLAWTTGLTVQPDGTLLVLGEFVNRVRQVTPAGSISTVAGDGSHNHSETAGREPVGDGGPATSAKLKVPGAAVRGADGSLYIADTWNNRVRKVAPSGTITTVAGIGSAGFSGDGGPAVLAELHRPADLALDHTGALLVADTHNHRVRRIGLDGTITTVAGNGEIGFTGDGAPAGDAAIPYPHGIAIEADGSLLVGDASHRLRRVVFGPDGDGDGVADDADSCPDQANADQSNLDGDALGDACDDIADVHNDSSGYRYVKALVDAGVTAGCGAPGQPVRYCPGSDVTRRHMSLFLLRAAQVSTDGSNLPPYAGMFEDVASSTSARFIEELARRGVTGGCATAAPGGRPLFCPEPSAGSSTRGLVTRQQMALFLLRTAQVSQDGRNLPPYAGTFSDVPDSVPGRFIEELARRDVTAGCATAAQAGGRPAYCPSAQVSRQAMAVFLVRMFDLPMS